MKHWIILLSFFTISCTLTNHEFALYDVNLMKDSYKNNHIRGFVKTWIVDGETYKIDSTILDHNGNIQCVFRLMAFGGKDTLGYDSFDRLAYHSNNSDTRRDFRIIYELIPDDRKVIQKWVDITGNDSTLAYKHTINYNNTLDTILSISTTMTGGTILTVDYKYENNRLVEIGPDNQRMSSKYFYDRLGKLERIIIYSNDSPYEIEFISNETGLVDSVLSVSDMSDSILFNAGDFRNYKFRKEDMNYYSYFK